MNPVLPGKKLTFCLLLLLLSVTPSYAQKSQLSRYHGLTIEEILALPEDKIDIGLACLVMAKDAYPNMNIEVFDKILDRMADQVKALLRDVTDPIKKICLMNAYIYHPGWWNDNLVFSYDQHDLLVTKKENWFLNGCLSTRKGSCRTMAMLYLALTDRLGWPVRGVLAPSHYFCRYVGIPDGNIEATSGGGNASDKSYITDLKIPKDAIKNGVYMRTLSKKEYLASLLDANARLFYEEGDFPKAIHYLELALSYNSTFSGAHWNMANYCKKYAEKLQSAMEQETAHNGSFLPPGYDAPPALREIETSSINYTQQKYQTTIRSLLATSEQHRKKAKELGIVLESPEDFLKSQKESIRKSKQKQTPAKE